MRSALIEERCRRGATLVVLIKESDYGGDQGVLAVHAEGSLEAEKLAILRSYDGRATQNFARGFAGIDDA